MAISQEYLTKIKDAGKHGTDFDCFMEVCDKWLKDRAKPTWKAVSKALDKINCHELSKNILKIYETGQLFMQTKVLSITYRNFIINLM